MTAADSWAVFIAPHQAPADWPTRQSGTSQNPAIKSLYTGTNGHALARAYLIWEVFTDRITATDFEMLVYDLPAQACID